MNFFEQELRKLVDMAGGLGDERFTGRVCYGKISPALRVKLRFVTQGIHEQYTAIQATIIKKDEGMVDSLMIRFADVFGKKYIPHMAAQIVPHIWLDGGKYEWYAYQPTPADFEQLANTLNDYLDMFRD